MLALPFRCFGLRELFDVTKVDFAECVVIIDNDARNSSIEVYDDDLVGRRCRVSETFVPTCTRSRLSIF